ncbi:MAG: MBL fold metallo-hydrolase [Desulfobacterales bacterium]|jgi:phosphoribosyl 1,2-cyclic phosphodiesterase|nr:MBL fold metallo-hydrolase [Desulfobacteraceae bacterium]MBT4363692.1 MBL fold metallo-hydrolase [Desulfobacteraceae bacterium]MBT7086260.1 MBL fold metallo-hydrolase [Desulfobacterales bacterium]MBT7698176.1 MBL fold metallo-hydrolase [Desulfobacterales bacterium]
MTKKYLKTGCSKKNSLSVCMLSSGSKGNAVYISDGTTSILLDAGLSGIKIQKRLESRGLLPENLDAILVSHEHSDHIRGVGVLSRRFDIPVYINNKTHGASPGLGKINRIKTFDCGRDFKINNLKIHPFSVSHDAKDPAGFTITQNGKKIGVATDLGIATHMVKEHLKDCSMLIIEANHDPVMLEEGPYPWPLKQRIKSRVGHLSNEDSKKLLMEVKHDHLSHVLLAHLSEQNNSPEKAKSVVGEALNNSPTRLSVALQDICSEVFILAND